MNISVFIPSNIFSDIPSLREKTVRVANLVRALILFRIKELFIFKYEYKDEELYKLLNFFRIPSYLRRYAFKKEKVFKFVGVSPPIRAFYEDDEKYRYGIVFKKSNNTCFINAGLKDLVILSSEDLKEGQIVKLVREGENWRIARNDEEHNFGFKIFEIEDLIKFLIKIRIKENLIIATSRKGKIFSIEDFHNLNRAQNIYILFGSPKEGLEEIFEKMGSKLEKHVDFIFNMFPNQGLKTIRTDEAIFGTLSILNVILR